MRPVRARSRSRRTGARRSEEACPHQEQGQPGKRVEDERVVERDSRAPGKVAGVGVPDEQRPRGAGRNRDQEDKLRGKGRAVHVRDEGVEGEKADRRACRANRGNSGPKPAARRFGKVRCGWPRASSSVRGARRPRPGGSIPGRLSPADGGAVSA